MRRLESKVAVVFGGGSIGEGWGNGKASAFRYAQEGAAVCVADVNPDAAAETVGLIEAEGGRAFAMAADVRNVELIEAVIAKAHETYGSLDILHNNVGMNTTGGVVETSVEDWDLVMDVNLKSVFLACKFAIPIMEEQGAGAIVNISSVASIRWVRYNYASYYASKAAINNLTRSIALQYADKGIRANSILPGLMDTPHIYGAMDGHFQDVEQMRRDRIAVTPMQRMGDAWDIANAAVFLASDEARYITGIDLCVDGGLHCKTH